MDHDEALGLAQILLALLVFALGIPALILETTAEERVRHLLHRRVPHIPMMLLMAFTLAVVGGLIWYTGVKKGFWLESIDLERTAKVLTIALLIFFGAFWLFMLKLDVRSWIVRWIAVRLRWWFIVSGEFPDNDVDDLTILGESAPSGHEKRYILSKVSLVFNHVAAAERYDGTVMSLLVTGLVKVLASKDRPGTAQNFIQAVEIIGELYHALKARRFLRKRDGTNLIETACKVGEAAVKASHETAASLFLDTLPEEKVLFRIGLAALRHKRYRVAVKALTKLEVVADEKDLLPKELIGLAAHFCTAGKHAREVGRKFSQRLDHRYSAAEISEAAQRASKEYCDIAEYTTADTIQLQTAVLIT